MLSCYSMDIIASEAKVKDAHGEKLAAKAALNAQLLTEAKKGDLGKVKQLLASGAELDARDVKGNSALHHAAKKGHLKVIAALVAAGIDVTAVNEVGDTALHLAFRRGHEEIVNFLGSKIREKMSPEEVIAKIIAPKIQKRGITEDKLSHIARALEAADEQNKQMATNPRTALHDALEKGTIFQIENLCDAGADLTARTPQGESVLKLAVKRGEPAVVALLISKGLSLADEEEAVCFAAKRGRLLIMELLLSEKVCAQVTQSTKNNALLEAAERGHSAIMRLLLTHGAEATAADCFGRTGLHLAAQECHMEAIILLTEAGADIDALCNEDQTILHAAVTRGNMEFCLELLRFFFEVKWRTPTKPLDAVLADLETEEITSEAKAFKAAWWRALYYAFSKADRSRLFYDVVTYAAESLGVARASSLVCTMVSVHLLDLVCYKDGRGRTPSQRARMMRHHEQGEFYFERTPEMKHKELAQLLDPENLTVARVAPLVASWIKIELELANQIEQPDQEKVSELYAAIKALEHIKRCASCEKEIEQAKRCGRCKAAYYCDAACQKAHWPAHRETCSSN